MPEAFDPYRKWLGIPPKDQPANHYRLLAIELVEDDPDVIEAAADQRMSHIRTYQTGRNGALSQRILNELSAAKICLLDPEKKVGYDNGLRSQLAVDALAARPAAAIGQARPPRRRLAVWKITSLLAAGIALVAAKVKIQNANGQADFGLF